MKNKLMILLVVIAVIFVISVIVQFALGVFKVGLWTGVILTLLVLLFIAAKIVGRKKA